MGEHPKGNHCRAHHRGAPEQKQRAGGQVGPVDGLGPAGLDGESIKVGVGASGELPLRGTAREQCAPLGEPVLPP